MKHNDLLKTVHRCEPCNISYKDRNGLRRHQREIHLQLKYSCNFCNHLGTKEKFTNYLKKSHPDKNLSVEECGTIMETCAYYVKGRKSKNRPCKQCDFIAGSYSTMRKHMRKFQNVISVIM